MISELLAAQAFATLTFIGLSSNPTEASAQKNLLMQSLRAAFPAPSAFIEETSATDFSLEPELEHYRLSLKCLSCFSANGSETVDTESVSYASAERKSHVSRGASVQNPESAGEFDFSFRVQSSGEVEAEREAQPVPAALEPSATDLATSSGPFAGTPSGTQRTDTQPKTWRLAISVQKLQFAIHTTRALDRGSSPQAEDFRIQPCVSPSACLGAGVFAMHKEAARVVQSISQKKVTRTALTPGRHVDESHFTDATIVERGSPVTVILESGSGLTLRTKGTALRSGSSGHIIPVQLKTQPSDSGSSSPSGSQTVQAKVTEKGEVRYER